MPYFMAPVVGWVASGCLKFLIHFFKYGKDARHHMGNGGFPSTHTSTVSTTVFLIGFGEGWFSAVFGLGVAFLVITMIDATGLRIAVGKQAGVINQLTNGSADRVVLRERMGHSKVEIAGGLALGFLCSLVLFYGWELIAGG
ncbi:divergent PAP2 family protein [Aquibacillus albus]|uniref:Acid phosphatase family membrane protein YuiD n=1 Tax=Aquibacillus albus TaxID=1168171 RepID=A0ABS2MZY7_9BACI|nr:divergent PAP2 family protein [Aquibacillus albus]MBM7571358.1 acid phosphatase family membrane protein YuiD [Aquibacillus albus]